MMIELLAVHSALSSKREAKRFTPCSALNFVAPSTSRDSENFQALPRQLCNLGSAWLSLFDSLPLI